MNANFYHINWSRLTVLHVPMLLRRPRMRSWLYSLVVPIKALHDKFLALRLDLIYKIEHTPQVYSMEKVLNEEFDAVLKRIYIEDGEYFEQLYVFSPEEELPIYIFDEAENQPVYFYGENDPESVSVDFNVVLPIEFQTDFAIGTNERNKLEALVNFYRLPDKTYKIIFE